MGRQNWQMFTCTKVVPQSVPGESPDQSQQMDKWYQWSKAKEQLSTRTDTEHHLLLQWWRLGGFLPQIPPIHTKMKHRWSFMECIRVYNIKHKNKNLLWGSFWLLWATCVSCTSQDRQAQVNQLVWFLERSSATFKTQDRSNTYNGKSCGRFTDAVVRNLDSIAWSPGCGIDEQTKRHHSQSQNWRTCCHADAMGGRNQYLVVL